MGITGHTQYIYLLSSGPEGSLSSHELVQCDPQSEVIYGVIVLFSFQQLRSHETCRGEGRGHNLSVSLEFVAVFFWGYLLDKTKGNHFQFKQLDTYLLTLFMLLELIFALFNHCYKVVA